MRATTILRRRVPAILIALAFLLMLLPASVLTVSAAGASVAIASGDDVATIQDNIQSAIDAAGSGDTVTVTGSKTDVDENLELTIPAGVTVSWQADYEGSTDEMLTLYGAGTLEVPAGGTLCNDNGADTIYVDDYQDDIADYATVAIVVSGGTVKATGEEYGSGDAIHCNLGSVTVTAGTVTAETTDGDEGAIYSYYPCHVTVSGGTVSCTGDGGTAIWMNYEGNYADDGFADAGLVTVSGGTVSATDSNEGYAIYTFDVNVLVTAGTVSAASDSDWCIAIQTDNGNVTVSGGTVSASSDNANYCIAIQTGNGNVTVSGGTMSAEGYNCAAIQTYSGDITMSGGALSVTGEDGWTIWNESGNVRISGGTVTQTGGGSGCVVGAGSGTIAITGGTVKSVGDCPVVGVYNWGAAAVLTGTCTGDFYVEDEGVPYGMIVEVDTLGVPLSRDGTADGLTTLAGEDEANSVVWDLTGDVPVIAFTLDSGDSDLQLGIEWGQYAGADVTVPVVDSVTTDSITVKASTVVGDNPGDQTVEYSISTDATTPGNVWQDGLNFTGLDPDTTYYVFARSKATDTFAAGAWQVSAAIKTAEAPAQTGVDVNTALWAAIAGAALLLSITAITLGRKMKKERAL